MNNLVLTFVFALICANSFAQSTEGREEFYQALFATSQNKYEKANRFFEKSYKKGYVPTNKDLNTNFLSPYRRLEALKKCAENGNSECMFVYGLENIDQQEYIANSISLKQFATPSLHAAYEYVVKAADAGYQPAYLYIGKKLEEIGDTTTALKMYQYLAYAGNKEGLYKLAILKKDAKAAFEVIKDIKVDPFLYDPFTSGEEIYNSAMVGNDPKFALEAAKIYSERSAKFTGIQGSHDLYESRAVDLYRRACDLENGEGCYQFGLRYLADYRDHENGLKWFDKANKFGFKVPDNEYLKMKNPPSDEDVKKVEARLQAQYERDVQWAKNHPNDDEISYKENTANTKSKSSLSKADMDNIIKANFPSSSSEDDRHRREMEKQARDMEKIKNGTWNGH